LKRGQVGEIVVAGEHVQKGYLNDPAAETRNKIRAGGEVWHRTGDAGYLAPQGLFLMGRLNQRIRRAGRTWWSLEAEQRALKIPGVRFAAYFGLPDAAMGERALLCLEGSATMAQAAGALGPFPIDELRCFAGLPRDPRHASKINLEALKAML
jgi:acyl-CoA synthetase (AMP-forming)/AMP-acid ligase II